MLALQGCCISRPSGPNSPYPGPQSGSAHAINSPTELIHSRPQGQAPARARSGSQPRTNRQQHEVSQGSRRHRRPLDQRINKPLRRHEWASANKTWSRAALDRERVEFFDTRVSGRPEVWQTLNAALEVLWEADITRQSPATIPEHGVQDDEHDPAVALATAQSILNAGDILLPTGDLANGAYDSLGNYYQLPPQVVCDPVNIVASEDTLGDSKNALKATEGTTRHAEEEDLSDDERHREKKGKGVDDVSSRVVAVIRLSETSKDLRLRVGKNETVRSIVRRVVEKTGVSSQQQQRLLHFISPVQTS